MVKTNYTITKKKTNFNKLKSVLKTTYDTKAKLPSTITKDTKLSGKRVSVYNDTESSKTYIVHRGTQGIKDWVTDFAMAMGYEGGKRFNHSKKIQEQTEKKYGSKNVITIGHSLGGRLAEKFGKNTSSIITYNKAVTPRSVLEAFVSPISEKQYDIRTIGDPVSAAIGLQRRLNPTVIINSPESNPIKLHGLDELQFQNLKQIS